MCLTLPAQIISLDGGLTAKVDLSGNERQVRLAFSDLVSAGDWVLINADLAVAKISAQEAQEINNYFK